MNTIHYNDFIIYICIFDRLFWFFIRLLQDVRLWLKVLFQKHFVAHGRVLLLWCQLYFERHLTKLHSTHFQVCMLRKNANQMETGARPIIRRASPKFSGSWLPRVTNIVTSLFYNLREASFHWRSWFWPFIFLYHLGN